MRTGVIISVLIALTFLISPVNADLYSQLENAVNDYNENVDSLPGTLQNILSDQHVLIVIYLYENTSNQSTLELAGSRALDLSSSSHPFATDDALVLIATTADNASVTKFGQINELDEYSYWNNLEFAETLVITTDEDTTERLLNSPSPGDEFMEAYNSGLIIIQASQRARFTTSLSLAILPWVSKLYMLIS